jgi:hemerythrin
MAHIQWSERLSVGLASIDSQHRKLVDLINDLYDAMMKGEGKTHTGPILKELIRYTHEHFADEEAGMQKAGYPDLAHHKELHRELTRQVEEFEARFEKGEVTLSISMLKFLNEWLTGHIIGVDKLYAPFIKEHGAQ